jgi:4-hydroxy-2-oxoheptanedioate aldolase
MGLPTGSLDGDETQFLNALKKIQEAADANNLPIMGFASTPAMLERRIQLGWRAFIIHGDVSGIYSSAVQGLQSYLDIANGIERYLPAGAN